MNKVRKEWNGLAMNFEVDYAKQETGKYQQGEYITKVQVVGLNACSNEMQVAVAVGLESLELPPQMCAELCEPSVSNPFLGRGRPICYK